jgi:hypothetical protein
MGSRRREAGGSRITEWHLKLVEDGFAGISHEWVAKGGGFETNCSHGCDNRNPSVIYLVFSQMCPEVFQYDPEIKT